MNVDWDVVIIGAGPAGLAAAIYSSRNRLSTVIFDKETIGGKLTDRELIENYPGYPGGVPGGELASKMFDQATSFGAELQFDRVEAISVDGNRRIVRTSQGEYAAKAVIVAGGAINRRLRVPGETEFTGNGVFYCATCDGPGFVGKDVLVAGGGDSGFSEALSMSEYVRNIVLVEALEQCKATRLLQERVSARSNIEILCGHRIESITGDTHVRAVTLSHVNTGVKSRIEADGVLVQIGLDPNSGYLEGTVALNSVGSIIVDDMMRTNTPGVFAAGDIRSNSFMQIATATGDGVTAAMGAHRYVTGT
jgi:thioredoxin reductase (NADPH)